MSGPAAGEDNDALPPDFLDFIMGLKEHEVIDEEALMTPDIVTHFGQPPYRSPRMHSLYSAASATLTNAFPVVR